RCFFIRPSFNRPDSNPFWRKFSVAGHLVRGPQEGEADKAGQKTTNPASETNTFKDQHLASPAASYAPPGRRNNQ
ncbi:hypothetical protein, partial [Rhizobium binxianense]|uniref:hypothetical protein n=1 Tax=Rhizobium binxianense TaxID=3024242 RepID=UPI002361F371